MSFKEKRKKILFVDWYNVLSKDNFFETIINDDKSIYFQEIKIRVDNLFSDKEVINEWMRGRLSTDEVLKMYEFDKITGTDINFWKTYLINELINAKINNQLLGQLKHLKKEFFIVLASDNTDFSHLAFKGMNILNGVFDDFLCSSEIGVLKSEDPSCFFGAIIGNMNCHIRHCWLIDDRKDNCEAFRKIGGLSILYENSLEIKSLLANKSMPN